MESHGIGVDEAANSNSRLTSGETEKEKTQEDRNNQKTKDGERRTEDRKPRTEDQGPRAEGPRGKLERYCLLPLRGLLVAKQYLDCTCMAE